MTTDMKLKMLKGMTGEEDKDVLSTYLNLAEKIVLTRAYPYANASKVPIKYDGVHLEIAAYLLNKRGAEGEVSHSENGVTRTYENGDIPSSLLRAITPVAEVL